jgi:hypothetical protein
MESIKEVFAILKAEEAQRALELPTDQDAIRVLLNAHLRLKELGWDDAIYCPKDGSLFEALEAGRTESGLCQYLGVWPNGRWWMHEVSGLWPSYPILWRPASVVAGFSPARSN